jgi:hypothetical protein
MDAITYGRNHINESHAPKTDCIQVEITLFKSPLITYLTFVSDTLSSAIKKNLPIKDVCRASATLTVRRANIHSAATLSQHSHVEPKQLRVKSDSLCYDGAARFCVCLKYRVAPPPLYHFNIAAMANPIKYLLATRY